MSVVEIKDLSKRYGDFVAVDNFYMKIEKGEIHGLVGPNGSGKTTAINSMLSILKYDSGSVEIFDRKMKSGDSELKRRIGYVPQDVSVIEELNVYENIDFFCGLYIEDKATRKKYVKDAIEFVGLEKYIKKFPKKLSGGILRRLNIACGIAHKPDFLVLDEPTVAVDPQSRNFILEGIKKMSMDGVTVLYTSHYMDEVENICSRISIMDNGKILITGNKNEIKKAVGLSDILTVKNIEISSEDIVNIKMLDGVENVYVNGKIMTVVIKKSISVSHCLTYLENKGIVFSGIEVKSPSLNDVFLEITGKDLRDL